MKTKTKQILRSAAGILAAFSLLMVCGEADTIGMQILHSSFWLAAFAGSAYAFDKLSTTNE